MQEVGGGVGLRVPTGDAAPIHWGMEFFSPLLICMGCIVFASSVEVVR